MYVRVTSCSLSLILPLSLSVCLIGNLRGSLLEAQQLMHVDFLEEERRIKRFSG